jgi:DnaJ-class molecular chaperone
MAIVNCSACGGSGRQTCSNCNGQGQVWHDEGALTSEGYYDCPHCDGGDKVCVYCDGAGEKDV